MVLPLYNTCADLHTKNETLHELCIHFNLLPVGSWNIAYKELLPLFDHSAPKWEQRLQTTIRAHLH